MGLFSDLEVLLAHFGKLSESQGIVDTFGIV